MERELRDAFDAVNTSITAGHARLETKIDAANTALNTHMVETAKQTVKIEMIATSAHSRIDEHLRGHWRWMAVLTTIAAGLIVSGIVALIAAVLKAAAKQA